jgi:hypothetical protein
MSAKQTRKDGDIKKQISELILGDGDILKCIAEAVSSAIIDTMCVNESFIAKIADKISQNEKHTTKIKQEVYESLSFDNTDLRAKITDLENNCAQLKKSYDNLQMAHDDLEQYGRRNCLIFHGIPEPPKDVTENTDAEIIKIVNDKLGMKIQVSDLDRSHRLRRKSPQIANSRPKPIIVKFTRHNTKSEVFSRKRNLKASGIGITESLTKKRLELYTTVSKHPGVKAAWTADGKVIALLSGSQTKVFLENHKDLTKLS